MYVVKKNNLYVSSNVAITKSSYTNSLQYAQLYITREDALRDCCIGNEHVEHLSDQFISKLRS
jgi:hypothetical protein